jgi:O-antigen/teichoic acid export membrane protein
MRGAASRSQRVLAGLGALVAGQGIRTLGHLVLVPVYLAYWPAGVYGEWLALSSLVAYLATLDLGVSAAGTNRLTQEYARGDLARYRLYEDSAMAFYVAVAAGGTALLTVLVATLPIETWLGVHLTAPRTAKLVVWMIGTQILLTLPVGFASSIYRTTGDLARSEWAGNTRNLLAILLVPAVLAAGGGVEAVAAVGFVPPALVAAVVVWDLRRRFRDLTPGLRHASYRALRDILAPSLLFLLITSAAAISIQGSVMLVSVTLGGAAVALFVVTRTLTGLVRQCIYTLNHTLWPHLTALDAVADHARLRTLHRVLVSASIALALGPAAVLWHAGPAVIALWTRGRIKADPVLLRLLVVHVVLQAPWLASSMIPIASNRHRTVALAYLGSSVCGLTLAAALIGVLGLHAVPVGLIVGDVVGCLFVIPRNACRCIDEPFGMFAVRQGTVLMVCAGTALGVVAIWLGNGAAGWWALLSCTVACTGCSAVVALLVGLDGHERRLLWSRLRILPVVDRNLYRTRDVARATADE